jgi:hypothetical protein
MTDEAFDADVVLGVAAKASQVFAQDDTFFSYPLVPIGFRQDDLRGMVAGTTAEGRKTLAEFSYLVNAIPTGPLWSPLPDDYLWEVYGDVLSTARLADSTRTKSEEAAYERAYSYLHDVHRDGSVSDAEAVLRYRQYRDAWLVLAEEYKNAAAEAEAASDPDVAKRWKEVTEPALREKQGEIERQWSTDGHRAEVEEAQQVEEELSQRSPAAAWAGYRKLFDPATPEIFFATDPDGGRYVPTSLRPSGVLDGAWGQMNLTREELTTLAAGAPAALRERLGHSADSGVEALSFEYSSVAISRSWFAPDVFASRGWQFADASKVICDGAKESPSGRCPAVAVALVLLRNLRVSRKPGEAALVAAPSFSLGALHVGSLAEVASPLEQMRSLVASPVAAEAIQAVNEAPEAVDAPPAMLDLLARDDFERIVIALPPSPGAPAEPAPGEAVETSAMAPDEVYVLGFVCKWVPKSPDPDYRLHWPGQKGPSWPGRELKQPPPTKGADVRKWEAQMKARGWSISVNGVFDSHDDETCRRFQAEKGLEVDGVVGSHTWHATWNAPIT